EPEKAAEALDRRFGARFGWSTEESAAAVHDLVVVNMATALREVSVGRGHDPREVVFLAYGGTLPLFAVQIAEQLGIGQVVIPTSSSVFSAMGLLYADFVSRYEQAVSWDMSHRDDVERINRVAERLMAQGVADMERDRFTREEIELLHS